MASTSVSSSSSPQAALPVSTPPSSDSSDGDKHAMEVDTTPLVAPSDSSDMEILEERNRSPQPAQQNKRKSQGSESPTESKAETKKLKLATAPKPKQAALSAAAGKGKGKGDAPAPLVELKKGKLVFKQKALELLSTISSMKAIMEFTTYVASLTDDDDAKLDDWPREHWPVVARMIHESDKTPQALLKNVKDQLVKLTSSALGDEDSQDAAPKVSLAERFPTAPLKTLIETLATRTNYGVDASDLPIGLPDGVTEMPSGLQIWRWELHDPELLPSELETKLLRHRAERVEAKSQAVDLVTKLPATDFAALFAKPSPSARKASAVKKDDSEDAVPPVASGSGDAKGKGKAIKEDKKPKVVKPEVDPAELAAQAKLRVEKDAEKAARKLAKDQATAEREEKKAKKLAAENEKKAKEDKRKAEISKQSGFLNGFFKKKSASPAPTSTAFAAAAGTPGGSKETDFARVFKPFHLKTDVELAPVNRFRKAKSSKSVDVQINSLNSLTLEESLASFLEGVPAHRIPPYNPHPTPYLSVRDAVHKINDASATGSDVSAYYQMLESRAKVPIKFLKFKEDSRPGYVGTWTKTSRVVGPRTPFGRDTALLRYDYDSEDEWEEDDGADDAEDVNSGGERSDEDDSDGGLSDDWLCEDDEVEFEPGHGDDDPVPMDVDGDGDCFIIESATDAAKRKVADREKKSKSAKDGARKRKLAGPLLPLVKGPYWEQTIGEIVYPQFESLKIQFLNDAPFGLDPRTFISKPIVVSSAAVPKAAASTAPSIVEPAFVPGITGSKLKPAATTVKPAKPLAPHLIPRVLDLVHGSTMSRQGIADECHAKMKDAKVTKASILGLLKDLNIEKIKVGDDKSERQWTVTPELRLKYPSSMVVD